MTAYRGRVTTREIVERYMKLPTKALDPVDAAEFVDCVYRTADADAWWIDADVKPNALSRLLEDDRGSPAEFSTQDVTVVNAYAQLTTPFPPGVIGHDEKGFFIVDGRHRLAAAIKKSDARITISVPMKSWRKFMETFRGEG